MTELAVRTDSEYLVQLHARTVAAIEALRRLVPQLPDGQWRLDTMRLARRLSHRLLRLQQILDQRPDVEREDP